MCFSQGKAFAEVMPTAPAVPSPIPNPFEGAMRGDASMQCDSRGAMWQAGFSVYFSIGFLLGWEITAKTTKSSPERCLK